MQEVKMIGDITNIIFSFLYSTKYSICPAVVYITVMMQRHLMTHSPDICMLVPCIVYEKSLKSN